MNTSHLRSAVALTGALGACLVTAPAHAQIVLRSAPLAVQSIARGGTAAFTVTLQNTGASTFFFLGDDLSFTSAPGPIEYGFPTSSSTVAVDDTPFSSFIPGASLAAGATQTFTMFNVLAGSASTLGSYIGQFTVQGNTDSAGAANDLVTQNFQLNVNAPVPEASTTVSFGLLLALGMGGVVVAARRKKAQAAS